MYIEQAPAIVLPKKRPLLKKILHGDEYRYLKEREENKHLGKRGWQIWFYSWQNTIIKKIFLENENDAIELFIEIHTPGFDPRKYNIPPEEIGHVQLLLTQALTSTSNSLQNFTVPPSWGPNTVNCIGGSGCSGGSFDTGGLSFAGGGGAGGGSFASATVQGLDRNIGVINFFIPTTGSSPSTSDVFFNGTSFNSSSVAAQGGGLLNTNVRASGGPGGKAVNSIGSVKFDGGDGGSSAPSSNSTRGGGGGGSAGGPSGAGTTANDTGISAFGSAGGNAATVNGGDASGTTANPGNNGTDFDASHGAGSGAGGAGASDSVARSGALGGLYGGGSSGASRGSNITKDGTNNTQGLIFISWIPYQYSEFYQSN